MLAKLVIVHIKMFNLLKSAFAERKKFPQIAYTTHRSSKVFYLRINYLSTLSILLINGSIYW